MDLREYLKSTSQNELAERIGVTQSAVSQWLQKRVPAERVLDLERASGGKVTRHELRPDLYPAEAERQAA